MFYKAGRVRRCQYYKTEKKMTVRFSCRQQLGAISCCLAAVPAKLRLADLVQSLTLRLQTPANHRHFEPSINTVLTAHSDVLKIYELRFLNSFLLVCRLYLWNINLLDSKITYNNCIRNLRFVVLPQK